MRLRLGLALGEVRHAGDGEGNDAVLGCVDEAWGDQLGAGGAEPFVPLPSRVATSPEELPASPSEDIARRYRCSARVARCQWAPAAVRDLLTRTEDPPLGMLDDARAVVSLPKSSHTCQFGSTVSPPKGWGLTWPTLT